MGDVEVGVLEGALVDGEAVGVVWVGELVGDCDIGDWVGDNVGDVDGAVGSISDDSTVICVRNNVCSIPL